MVALVVELSMLVCICTIWALRLEMVEATVLETADSKLVMVVVSCATVLSRLARSLQVELMPCEVSPMVKSLGVGW